MPEIGNNSAAIIATQLLNDFTSIRFGLLVRIGGGIPSNNEDDIRLEDVIVSKPATTFGGVVQFDWGKIHPEGKFERTGALKKPPAVLMANVQRLEAQHRRVGNQTIGFVLPTFPQVYQETKTVKSKSYWNSLLLATMTHPITGLPIKYPSPAIIAARGRDCIISKHPDYIERVRLCPRKELQRNGIPITQ
jgi:hypothetical protein